MYYLNRVSRSRHSPFWETVFAVNRITVAEAKTMDAYLQAPRNFKVLPAAPLAREKPSATRTQ